MKKLKCKKGFTLVELLACIVTLLLIAGIVSTGSNIAMRSFNQSTYESNSQMLEDTLDMYLKDILRHARLIETDEEGKVVEFTNATYQIYEGMIVLDEETSYLKYVTTEGGREVMLIAENMYAGTLYLSDFELNYDYEKKYFKGSYNIKSTMLEDVERHCEFTCRTIAEN